MIHTLQGFLASLVNGLSLHLQQWDGWAVLLATALIGFRAGTRWMPLLVAIIVNPAPYGVVAALLHGRAVALNTAVTFTVVQIIIAYAGFAAGRLLTRLR